MNRNRYVPTVNRLEPRELLTGQPNPLDPVLPPNDGQMNIIIITPIKPPTPHLPPGPVIA